MLNASRFIKDSIAALASGATAVAVVVTGAADTEGVE